ncbi:MAG: CpXC domain-containing protein [Christensenella hongkongensis]|uniref:CpXC domain-containing protein n=1 Tax=Christensenella hongkongensis TaxID=270498 RepID=UPI002A749EA3|nr:CpXC domain-containing protein [Christensenella hongkongensis]MDY3005097.1 CpXC domain-containing protein [Christensenella hongkongensis]
MEELVTCSKCGNEFSFERIPVIDVKKHPVLKQQALDLSLFRVKCGECGADLMFPYPCVYHDPDKKIMIRLIPDQFTVYDLPAAPVHNEDEDTLRDVRSIHSLREKILIFDRSMDDRAIELLKILTVQQNPERFDAHDPDVLLLADTSEDALSFFALAKDGNDFILKTPLGLYEQMLGELDRLAIDRPSCFQFVDNEWILEQFRKKQQS